MSHITIGTDSLTAQQIRKWAGGLSFCQDRHKPFINGPGYLLHMITMAPKTDLSE